MDSESGVIFETELPVPNGAVYYIFNASRCVSIWDGKKGNNTDNENEGRGEGKKIFLNTKWYSRDHDRVGSIRKPKNRMWIDGHLHSGISRELLTNPAYIRSKIILVKNMRLFLWLRRKTRKWSSTLRSFLGKFARTMRLTGVTNFCELPCTLI